MVKHRKPTTLDYALLGLLHQGAQSGYDLRKVFAETALGNYSSSPGAIYPALKRLEERDLIEGTVDSSTELRPRKLYRPTRAGRAALREWLLAEISLQDIRRGQDELQLRFAFYSVLGDPGATRRFLESLAAGIDEYLEELTGQLKILAELENSVPDMPVHGRLAFELGIQQIHTWARWVRETLHHFEE